MFFQDLRADNTKAYWSAHKDFYEASVREPMAELLDELSGEFGPGRIARPYRDMRFRAGKSPYKTEIYATLDRGGYVRFGADGLTAALGYYMMTSAQLELWVPKTYATWADVLHLAAGSVPRLVSGQVGGADLAEGAMILGLWA